jgi:CxxC motif-containing protein (DUF1111 family)
MRQRKLLKVGLSAVLLMQPLGTSNGVNSQDIMPPAAQSQGRNSTEASTGFDNRTNGLTDQATFEADRAVFEEAETIEEGLGPVFNARGCAECHSNPVIGGNSQIVELRAGHFDGKQFVEHPGGSLIQERAIDAAIQEYVLHEYEVRTFRLSPSILGAGFIEAISSQTLADIASDQPSLSEGRIAGQLIKVPVLEGDNALRAGRFGWKNQHASLISFAAEAYLLEIGITSPLQPTESTSIDHSVEAFDVVPDPEDDGEDIENFARFMRATKAPPRDAELAMTPDAQAGEQIFQQIGCAICHVPTIITAQAGTVINGGAFTVPEALGNKIIHPFSDFLLHDVGSGDGIVQNGGQGTRNKIRTAPLWGLRTRSRFMHDGLSLTPTDAILRHAREALGVIDQYRGLSTTEKDQLLAFLRSL